MLRRVPRGVGRDPHPLVELEAGEGRGPRLVPDCLWIGSGLAGRGAGALSGSPLGAAAGGVSTSERPLGAQGLDGAG